MFFPSNFGLKRRQATINWHSALFLRRVNSRFANWTQPNKGIFKQTKKCLRLLGKNFVIAIDTYGTVSNERVLREYADKMFAMLKKIASLIYHFLRKNNMHHQIEYFVSGTFLKDFFQGSLR